MRADETRLGTFLDGPTQYVVPYFQRSYSWRRRQWNTLYEDILELYEGKAAQSHFLGSIVLLAEDTADGLDARLLIDGQQRVVTLSLFLAAIRDTARATDPALADRLQFRYLVNRGAGDLDQVKVHPTYQDQAAYASVVLGAAELPASPVRDAYRTFMDALSARLEAGFNLERLVQVVLSQLSFVAITLDAEDNPYRVFESLNAKGMPLTQGDLLRNYFFMRLPPAEHEHWYRSVWAPMQARLGTRFDDFMRDFFVKEGEVVRPEEVYQGWRKRLTPLGEEDVRQVLRDLGEWSVEYDRLLHPERETDPAVRHRLERLTAWSSTLTHPFTPFLLRLRADFSRGLLSGEQLEAILLAVESFLVRRLFRAAPMIDEHQLLVDLYGEAGNAPARAERFLAALAQPQLGWPGDDELREGMVRYPLYFRSHPDQRKLILAALEESYPHRGPIRFQDFELELIVPLLPRDDWRTELGVTEEQHWKLVGTLGNFTWKARDQAPSLKVAERKRELGRLARYGMELARDVAGIERWTAAAIEQRSERLAERALSVWPGPRR